ncbi:hypothetical protein JM18_007983 [Phytophthora kernoviae]|uniref:Uncharacterized protein n=1 Tax=Phytophthora kernoviae TaxID=325452 RepID=A0A921V562_9STRA|nr:hypothetical protein JM18_007983 [Phytophthora kernoviae]
MELSTAPKNSTASPATTTATTPPSPQQQQRKKRQRISSISSDEASPKKLKKRLRWSTITIHEFGVGLGGSSVSGKGGPSIGLGDTPEFTWTTKVGQMAERCEGVHRFSPDERVQLLRSAGVSDGMILRFSREANIINGSRRRTLVEDIAERKEAKKALKVEAMTVSAPTVVERPSKSLPRRYTDDKVRFCVAIRWQ